MLTLAADLGLALVALLSFVFVGLAVLRWWRLSPAGLETLAVAAALGVLMHALAGLAVAVCPAKGLTAWTMFVLLWGGSAWSLWARRGEHRGGERYVALWDDQEVRWTTGIVLGFIVCCVSFTHLHVRFPRVLPDGNFIFKEHTLPVKMQVLTGTLPVDNYLPFVAEEYLLHDLSFAREHPIIPGQEVTNRPLLMALVVLPFRAALDRHPQRLTTLGRFQYVGTDWPDTGVFMEGPGYRYFLMVSIVLNALVLLGGALVVAEHGPRSLLVPGLLLLATSPFYLVHTLFCWPKLLAAFYLLLALHFMARGKNSGWVALFGALAYHSHPYALVFLCCFGCHYLAAAGRSRQRAEVHRLLRYVVTAGLLLAPWYAWVYLWIKVPSNLIALNLAGNDAGTAFSQTWTRLSNLHRVLDAGMFEVLPFDIATVFQRTVECLPGVLGLLTLPAYWGLIALWRSHRLWIVQGIVAPALLLSLAFSKPTPLMRLAYHSIGLCLILLGLILLARLPRRIVLTVLAAQIGLQVTLLLVHARALEATFADDGTVYRFLDHRPEIVGALHQVNFHVDIEAGSEHQESIWSEPPTALVYRQVRLPVAPLRFCSRIALHPLVWALGGADGAEFALEVRPVDSARAGGDVRRVWTAFVDPVHHPEQRAWLSVEVDLSEFAGRTVDLTLRNGPGPDGNDYGDWCLWGDPVLQNIGASNPL